MLVSYIFVLLIKYSLSTSLNPEAIIDPIFGTDSAITASFYSDILEGLDCGCDRVSNLNVSEIQVHLYNFETNSNATYTIDEAAIEIFNRSDFNTSQCIQIFIPGYRNTNDGPSSKISRCVFSNIRCDGIKPLALIFDHSAYTNSDNIILQNIDLLGIYKKAVRYAKSIGVKIGETLVQLLEKVDRDKIDIIGHSLGGQIVGYVGETVINRTSVPLKRIYAADPAGPCYENCPNEHLNSDQAELVVAIHCNAGELGSNLNLTHYDFYSRNGQNQETCVGGSTSGIVLRALASSCSHGKCVSIAEYPSLRQGIWKAVKCSSGERYLNSKCNENESSLAGFRVTPTNSTGVYYFTPEKDLQCDQ